MTNEELMIPRYKVIVDYPNNHHFKVGDILMPSKDIPEDAVGKFIDSTTGKAWVFNPEKYPTNLTELKWFEERVVEDMPKYVKCIVSHMEHCGAYEGQIFEILEYDLRYEWNLVYINVSCKTFPLSYLTPSTEEEFNSQNK